MTRWFHSLQFRLIVGFAFVLLLALAVVGIYGNLAAQREVRDLRHAADEALFARIHEALTEYYAASGNWSGVANTVERVSYLTGRDITLHRQRWQCPRCYDTFEQRGARTQRSRLHVVAHCCR